MYNLFFFTHVSIYSLSFAGSKDEGSGGEEEENEEDESELVAEVMWEWPTCG